MATLVDIINVLPAAAAEPGAFLGVLPSFLATALLAVVVAVLALAVRSFFVKALKVYFEKTGQPGLASGLGLAVNLVALFVILNALWDVIGFRELKEPVLLVLHIVIVVVLAQAFYKALAELLPAFLKESGLEQLAGAAPALAFAAVYAAAGVYLLRAIGFYVPFEIFQALTVVVLLLFAAYAIRYAREILPPAMRFIGLTDDMKTEAGLLVTTGIALLTVTAIARNVPYVGPVAAEATQLAFSILSFSIQVGILLALVLLAKKMK